MPVVAVLMPGEMGHAVGGVLQARGATVLTCLDGRSGQSRARAQAAGLQPVADMRTLLARAELVLSILPPSAALPLAENLASQLAGIDARPLLVDCNAVSPDTARRIGEVWQAADGRFVDAGIIGPPPKADGSTPKIYVSGEARERVMALRDFGLDIRDAGPAIGDASAVKMCYASLTKGLQAIGTQLAVTAERLGVSELLWAELDDSQADLTAKLRRQIPAMLPKAYRWIGEMEEIAATQGSVGLSERLFLGAADLFRHVAASDAKAPAGFDDAISNLAAHRSNGNK